MQGGKLMEFGGGGRVKREWQEILPELLMKIVSLLDDRTVIVAAGVCSGWRNVICTQLTHKSVITLANNCLHLRNLNISYCTALTAPAVQALCDSFPALHTCPGRQSLIIRGCKKLTSAHCACASQPHRTSRRA
ncbi:putative F-box domain, leucine-rich repeat domain superfamily, F-box-like domain superfamily [Helianthus anomalus]